MNLDEISHDKYDSLTHFLSTLHTIIHFFDYQDERKIHAARARNKGKKSKSGTTSLTSDSGNNSESLSNLTISKDAPNEVLENDSETNSHNSHHGFRASLMGKKLFGRKKENKQTKPAHNKASFSGLFSRHSTLTSSKSRASSLNTGSQTSNDHSFDSDEDYDEYDLSSFSSAGSQGTPTRQRTGSSFFSSHSIRSGSTASSGTSSALPVVSNPEDAHGTGTYHNGVQSKYLSNMRTENPTMVENIITPTRISSSIPKQSRPVLKKLVFCNEEDLPFSADSFQSFMSLVEMLIDIYRSIRENIESKTSPKRQELEELDRSIASVEVAVRRLVINRGIVAMDASVFGRNLGRRSKDIIEKDILKFSKSAKSLQTQNTSKGFFQTPSTAYHVRMNNNNVAF